MSSVFVDLELYKRCAVFERIYMFITASYGLNNAIILTAVLQFAIDEVNSLLVDGRLPTMKTSSEFCHVNNFSETSNIVSFHKLHPIHVDDMNETFIMHQVDKGSPFVVSGITRGWKASDSTLNSPEFCDDHAGVVCEDGDVYYGVFLNNPQLADYLRDDYHYPEFIPTEWWVKGNEWIHWGHPPCGAKRHMDLTCTSRVSVQVGGSKEWHLYPLVNETDPLTATWKKVLQPYSVMLLPGDALFWFPGWEHETRIITGLSVSLSLHYTSPKGTVYQKMFWPLLAQRVSRDCDW